MNRRNELLEEILQITSQYKDEVPGKRKAWPKAIKERVRELNELGMNVKAICERAGLPYYTVLSWRPPKRRVTRSHGEFKQVPIVINPRQLPAPIVDENRTPKKTATVAVEPPRQTVTVTTPLGFRIEGLELAQVRAVIEGLR
jgi:hypothetical protein